MALNTLAHLSTSTPASEVSSSDFYRNDGQGSQQELAVPNFDDIMKNSPAAEILGLKKSSEGSLPDDGEDVPTPEDASDEDPDAEASAENEAGNETEDESAAEDETTDDKSTQGELPTEEEIDWEYRIPVQVNGKTEYKTLAEVRKGFATDQHLSQKGRELGEQKKQLEEAGRAELDKLVQLGTVLHQEITSQEQELEAQYATITAQIKKAKDEGDNYTARDLKDKQEEIQETYWKLRNKREQGTKAVVEQIQKQQAEAQQKLLSKFQEEIPNFIPNFDEKTAKSIRKFAIDEGIPEELLDSVYDARVVKFINEYRKLKQAKEVGAVKRKAAPAAKSIPIRKTATVQQKQVAAEQASRERVLRGQAGEAEQLDFLKRISSVSRKI